MRYHFDYSTLPLVGASDAAAPIRSSSVGTALLSHVRSTSGARVSGASQIRRAAVYDVANSSEMQALKPSLYYLRNKIRDAKLGQTTYQVVLQLARCQSPADRPDLRSDLSVLSIDRAGCHEIVSIERQEVRWPGGRSKPSSRFRPARSPRSSLEIPTGAEFHESRLDDGDRPLPSGAECVVLDKNRVRVERVVQVDVQVHAAATDADDLREAQIELIQSVSVQRTRLDQIDVGLPQRERPTE